MRQRAIIAAVNSPREVPISRTVHLIALTERGLIKVGTLECSKTDLSVYVRPAVPVGGGLRAGVVTGFNSGTIDAALWPRAPRGYVSFHQSGQTHASLTDTRNRVVHRTADVEAEPLFTSPGGHIGTLNIHGTAGLPVLNRVPQGAPNLDLIMQAPDNVLLTDNDAFRVVLYVRPDGAKPDDKMFVTMRRSTWPKPLYIALAQHLDEPVETDPGVGVMGGWGANHQDGQPMDFVMLATVDAL